MSKIHRSGFVNIVGYPNVGKSTLMNALVGEKMSIITKKPQTTRHRIIGLLSDEDYQVVFSDTPGLIDNPHYRMQESMNNFAYSVFEDGDIILFMVEPKHKYEIDHRAIRFINKSTNPVILIINKVDKYDEASIKDCKERMHSLIKPHDTVELSALKKIGTDELLKQILDILPEGPVYYPKDQLSDRPERFFIGEIIRQNLLKLYHEEIPYSCEIEVDEFRESIKNDAPFVHIHANIYVNRKTQKTIIIGKGGQMIKKLGIGSRMDIEDFIEKRIHLELFVKVKENWRDNDRLLKSFGYLH